MMRDGPCLGKDSGGSGLGKDYGKLDKNPFAALSDMNGTQRDSRKGKMVETNEDSEVAGSDIEEDLVRFSPANCELMVNKNMENSGNLPAAKGPGLAGLPDSTDRRLLQTEPPDIAKDKNPEALVPVAEAVSKLWNFGPRLFNGRCPQPAKRRVLWEFLQLLAAEVSGPLIISGDFNAILNHYEKKSSIVASSRHQDFARMVRESWIEQPSITSVLKQFTESAKLWNRETFGNIGNRKRKLIARTKGAQAALEVHHSHNLVDLEQKLKDELEEVLDLEEILWRQKPRDDCYQGTSGALILVNSKARLFLSIDSYTQFQIYGQPYPLRGCFPSIKLKDLEILNANMTKEEIRSALFEMKPLQAPVSDGLHAQFFQSQWGVVGDSICRVVMGVFQGAPLESALNRTSLVLIPKVQELEFLTEFQPISLCSVLYKLITKIIVRRMANFMKYVVSPNQLSFIAGRSIIDNVVIAQECDHSMNKCKTQTGWMSIKVDLENAYDRIQWEFLEDCMMDLGLPQQLISLIMECVSTATMQVLWNGSPTSVFKPERDIHQGDPLLPYLFVLGMEKLSHSINKSVQDRDWDPIRLARHGSPVSHLFFVDDLVLFCKADMKNARTLKSILDKFNHHSRHKVSASKTQLFFSLNIDVSLAQAIENHLQFQSVCNLGKYLGIPIFHGRVTKNKFQYLIDKVRARLNGWSASSLSLAGRITLAKVVLNCNSELLHAGGPPSRCSGLGIRDLRVHNQAFMVKFGFRIILNKDALSVRILREKYKIDKGCPTTIKRANCSFLWGFLSKVWNDVHDSICWSIGNGKLTKFWLDVWISSLGPLINHTVNDAMVEVDAYVCDFVDERGNWKWTDLNVITQPAAMQIVSICPPNEEADDDLCVWRWKSNGKSSVAEAYGYFSRD
ncbi:hypothetical protein SASPL_117508 [Salvia splendens]|uniref:Reverse transcriptase domain-containing protein n=1 Tax=Salvia splendens TaxID=180675 RepID=A0A8X8ZWC8_SALSN|nr:hypothetical protein SASPL_117508 [Salvia splendens]